MSKAEEPAGAGRPGMVVLAFAALSLWYSFCSLFFVDHNDFMYAASAVRGGALYTELHYVQAPFGLAVWKLVGMAAPEGYRYLSFRAVSTAMLLASVGLVLAFVLRTTAGRLLFLLFVASSYYLIRIGAEIGTYSLSLLLVAAAFAALWQRPGSAKLRFIAGLMIGLAAGAKLNHALFMLPFAAWVLFLGHTGPTTRSRMFALTTLGAGFLVGTLPCLVAFANAPKAFMLHNLYFHAELTRQAREWTLSQELGNVAEGLLGFVLSGHGVAIVALSLIASASKPARPAFRLHLLLAITALLMAVSPLYLSPQYLAPASLFVGLALAQGLQHASTPLRRRTLLVLVPILLLPIAFWSVNFAYRLYAFGNESLLAWQVHRINRQVDAFAERFLETESDCEKELFTLSGALAVDTGFRLARYTEAGAFWAHLNGFVPDRYVRDKAYGLDPHLIAPDAWVRRHQIDFLITGWRPHTKFGDFARGTEERLAAYARQEGFAERVVGTVDGQAIVFAYRPSCIAATADGAVSPVGQPPHSRLEAIPAPSLRAVSLAQTTSSATRE